MSVIDILLRVDTICKKYDKYDVEKQRSSSGGDAFGRLFTSFASQINATMQKSGAVAMETNRAKAVAMNAEVRRMKARLMEESPKLQKLAHKKVKALTTEEQETRNELVLALQERILAIPDGTTTTTTAKQNGGWATSSSHKRIQFDFDGDFERADYFQQTEEASQFRTEYEMRKLKQDQGLDVISEGLDVLKNLARDMNEELDKQIPLVEEIDTKVEKATVDLKNNNVRLKETLMQIRSSRNFCIDIILLCIILGIAAYLYK